MQMASVTLKYLRAGGMNEAVMTMRDNNVYPCRIKPAEDNSLKEEWTNIPEVLWRFGTHYRAVEGLDETHEMGRSVLVYLFHGKYTCVRTVRKTKVYTTKPVIHALHFQLTSHRSRFVAKVEEHFSTFFQLLREHPDWEKFVDDMGVGEPPRSYLCAVEEGIRSYAFDPKAKLTMGTRSESLTREGYGRIRCYRKMEAYITAVRFKRGRTTYNKWNNFLWTDYYERNTLAQTFKVRHLPLSDGEDHFGGELKDPPQWNTGVVQVSKPRRKGHCRKKGNNRKTTVVKSEPDSNVPMRFDDKTGSLIPYIDLS